MVDKRSRRAQRADLRGPTDTHKPFERPRPGLSTSSRVPVQGGTVDTGEGFAVGLCPDPFRPTLSRVGLPPPRHGVFLRLSFRLVTHNLLSCLLSLGRTHPPSTVCRRQKHSEGRGDLEGTGRRYSYGANGVLRRYTHDPGVDRRCQLVRSSVVDGLGWLYPRKTPYTSDLTLPVYQRDRYDSTSDVVPFDRRDTMVLPSSSYLTSLLVPTSTASETGDGWTNGC